MKLLTIILMFVFTSSVAQTYFEKEDVFTQIDFELAEFNIDGIAVLEGLTVDGYLRPITVLNGSILCENDYSLTIMLDYIPAIALTKVNTEEIIWFRNSTTISNVMSLYGELLEHNDSIDVSKLTIR